MATRHKTRPPEDQNAAKRPVGKRLARKHREDDQEIRARTEVGKAAPEFDVLEKLADKFPPPQEWWDENFDGL